MQQILKEKIVLGVIICVLGPCGCLLWSYVVKTLCLDTNKTRWVDVDPPLEVLVFFEGTQIPTSSRL